MDGVRLNAGEAIEPLDDRYIVIQPTDGYRFGGDSTALASYASRHLRGTAARVFDLCSGCGVIGMSVAIANEKARVVGAEIDCALADMSVRAAQVNGLNAKFYNADIRKFADAEYAHIFERGGYDAVVCNPPYYKANMPTSPTAPAANAELTVCFSDVAKAAAWLLRDLGAFFAVHWAFRLDEITGTLNANGLTPKELIVNRNGKTFMIKAVKNSRPGLSVKTGVF